MAKKKNGKVWKVKPIKNCPQGKIELSCGDVIYLFAGGLAYAENYVEVSEVGEQISFAQFDKIVKAINDWRAELGK